MKINNNNSVALQNANQLRNRRAKSKSGNPAKLKINENISIKSSRNINLSKNVSKSVNSLGKNVESSTTEKLNFKLDFSYNAKNVGQMYNRKLENNIKISIDSSFKGNFDSLKLDVAVQNKASAGASKTNINISLKMLQNQNPSQLVNSTHGNSGRIYGEKVDNLLNLKLDVNVKSSNYENVGSSFFDSLSDKTSDNIMDFIKSRFDLAMNGDKNPSQNKIDQFFNLIKNAVQKGYDMAKSEIGDIPEDLGNSLQKTLDMTYQKLEIMYSEKTKVSSK